jgi:thioredoxin 1
MSERLLITLLVGGSLFLLWLGWQYYKTRLARQIEPHLEATGQPALLYFTGAYCTVCKFQQTPIVNDVAAKFGEALTVHTVDVSVDPDLAHTYKVLTLPTTVIVDGHGRAVEINYGLASKTRLENQLQKIIQFNQQQSLANELQLAA